MVDALAFAALLISSTAAANSTAPTTRLPIATQEAAAAAEDSGAPPNRIRSVLLRAGERCPPAVGNEVVVCSTLEEPYRIPRRLRETPPSPANRAWATRLAGIDEVSRRASGIPNSCSTVGSGGQTGCTQTLIERWRTERRAQAADTSTP